MIEVVIENKEEKVYKCCGNCRHFKACVKAKGVSKDDTVCQYPKSEYRSQYETETEYNDRFEPNI